jgi:large subunit ribosomal protein L19
MALIFNQNSPNPVAAASFRKTSVELCEKIKMSAPSIIQQIEQAGIRTNYPNFRIGDTLRVFFRISEGDKERVQVYEGVLIGQKRGGNRSSIRVRKISFGEGVERVFPLASPRIEKIEIVQTGRVRRAKLYYLRELSGKKARIKERQDFTRFAQK